MQIEYTQSEVARADEEKETLEAVEERKLREKEGEKKNEDNSLEEEKKEREAYRKAELDAQWKYFVFWYKNKQIEYAQSEAARADEKTLDADTKGNIRDKDGEEKKENNPLEEVKKGTEDNDDRKE